MGYFWLSIVAVSTLCSSLTVGGSTRSEPSGFSRILTSWSLVSLFLFAHSRGRLIIRVLLLPHLTSLRVCFFTNGEPSGRFVANLFLGVKFSGCGFCCFVFRFSGIPFRR